MPSTNTFFRLYFLIQFFTLTAFCTYTNPIYATNTASDTLKPKTYRKYAKKINKAILAFKINPKDVYNEKFKDWSLSAGAYSYAVRIEHGYVDTNKVLPFLVIYGKLADVPEDEDTWKEMFAESLAANYNADYNKIALSDLGLIYMRVISLKGLSVTDIKNILLVYTGEFAEKADYYQQKYPNTRSRKT